MGWFDANDEPGGQLLGRIQAAVSMHEDKLNKGETVEVAEPDGTTDEHWKWCRDNFGGYRLVKGSPWFFGNNKVKITKKK